MPKYTCKQKVNTRDNHSLTSNKIGALEPSFFGTTVNADDDGLHDGVYWITYMGKGGNRVYSCRFDPRNGATYWE